MTYTATKVDNSIFNQYDSLGAEIKLIPGSDKRYEQIDDYVKSTLKMHRHLTIRNIYSVKIPTNVKFILIMILGKKKCRTFIPWDQ